MTKLAILDYDDTLLCSSYIESLQSTQGKNAMEFLHPLLKDLEKVVCLLFNKLRLAGYLTVIVTNAESGWVELSSSIHIPQVKELLEQEHIEVISANTRYANICPGNPYMWKSLTFRDLVVRERANPIELLSVGDSSSEIKAIEFLINEKKHSKITPIPSMTLRHIKFLEYPTPQLLIHELDMLISHLDIIISSTQSLKLFFKQPSLNDGSTNQLTQHRHHQSQSYPDQMNETVKDSYVEVL